MTQQMEKSEVLLRERINAETTWTNNQEFDKNGYLVVRDLWDPKELYHPVPEVRGQLNYWGKKLDQFIHDPVEHQVEGSTARYWHPQYRTIHSGIRIKLEKLLCRKLYNTYYYDRFYFEGQELSPHVDRDACEISVTVHASTNLNEDWPIWIKTPDTYTDHTKKEILELGKNHSTILSPGDGMIYKGCERPHWRNAMPTEYERTWYGMKKEKKGIYYHQIFFHYVLQDGIRAQCAGDK